jgi:outer membrane receptor for ferrienterochelin and colicins
MLTIKKLSIVSLLISFLIVFLPLISAQEEQKKKQEVTEEFFYAEEEVEIASLKAQPVEEAPGIVSVITAQQIKDMGARDLNDVLRTIPGFQLPVSIWYAKSYTVRGLPQLFNNRVLVMMDGVPLNEPYYGQSNTNWADMPLNNVKRIEVIRGPGSALYGTYAFLAVINILTNKAEDIDGVELSAGGGSWNTQHHYLLAGKTFGDLSLSGYVDYRRSDGYDNYWIEQDLVSLLYSYVPFLPSVSMAPGKIQVPLDSKRVDVKMVYKDFEFQFKAQNYERGLPLSAYAVTDGFLQADKSYIGKAIYECELSKKLSISLIGDYYYKKQRIYGQIHPNGIYGPLLSGIGAQGFFIDGILADVSIEEWRMAFASHGDYKLSETNTLTFGVEYSNLKTNKPIVLINKDPLTGMQSDQFHELAGSAGGFMDRSASRDVLAAFMQDSWRIAEKLNLTAGLRVDHYSEFGSTVNPRISIVWNVLKDTNIKLLYGHAFRAPAFSELYIATTSMVGNERLNPEKIRSFEIGINQKLNPNISTSINYFYNSLTDLIMPTGEIVVEGWPPQLENSGKINAQGIEAEVKANFKKNTYAYFNYSYARAKNELTGEVVPNVANNLFNFGVNVEAWKYLNANLNMNYVGERKRGNQILALFGIPDPRDPIKAYSLFDLTLRGQNFWKNTEIILSIHNLLDTEYTDPEEQGIIYYDFPREGRQILGKVIFKF